jgi:hypothetical protein
MQLEKQADGSWRSLASDDEVLWYIHTEKQYCDAKGVDYPEWLVPLLKNAGLLPQEYVAVPGPEMTDEERQAVKK